MKRVLSILLVLPLAAWGNACKSGGDDNPASGGSGPGAGGGSGGSSGSSGSSGPESTPGDGGNPNLDRNPIEGIAPAKTLLETGAFTDGPIWDGNQKVVFFTTPLGEGGLYRVREDGSAMKVRDGSRALLQIPIGNTITQDGTLVTFEASRIMRGGHNAEAGAPVQVAAGYVGQADGGAGGANTPFDTLNDGVVGPDGSLYVTDPGYFATPIANRLYRVLPSGNVTVVEAFEDVPRPNGIALSPDKKTLYVGFSQPQQGTTPFVRRYIVNDDGSLGEHAKFADIQPADSAPDGVEVDQGGNVYIATRQGVQVLKADGTIIGTIAVPEIPTGMAFGGKDLQTLFITTQGTKMFTVRVNVPGIVQ